uniref:Vascular endothelial growth factor B n=1 Tax=Canis lupus familiaris TaxID=9615 RepID=A0A8I3S7S1_CANLF
MGPLLRSLLLAALLQLAPAQVRASPTSRRAARLALSQGWRKWGDAARPLPRGPAGSGCGPGRGEDPAGASPGRSPSPPARQPSPGPLPCPTPSPGLGRGWGGGVEPPGARRTWLGAHCAPGAPRLGDWTLLRRHHHHRGQGRSQVARRGQGPVSQPDALSHQKKVVSWIDVYARATCQPREVVVPLTVELMGTVAKQLVPSCVTVQRCGGCCPDDGLECVPTGQHQVRMQILMIRYPSSQLGEMSLEEHSQCECRPKKRESALKPDSPRPLCPRCTQRRQRPDPRTCRCRCQRRSFLRCQGRGLELNPDTCRCRKLRR